MNKMTKENYQELQSEIQYIECEYFKSIDDHSALSLKVMKMDFNSYKLVKFNELLFMACMNYCKMKAKNSTSFEDFKKWYDKYSEIKQFIYFTNIPLGLRLMDKYGIRGDDDRDDALMCSYQDISNCIDKFNPNLGFRISTYMHRAYMNGLTKYMRSVDKVPIKCDIWVMDDFMPSSKQENNEKIDLLREIIEKNTTNLTARELDMVKLMFGFSSNGSADNMTYKSVGKAHKVTREMARRIINKSITTIKTEIETKLSESGRLLQESTI